LTYELAPQRRRAEVRVIASPANWIEGSAVQQLEKTAELEGMRLAVGLPDLHPGKGSPIGAAFFTSDRFYPTLVGNDIGCGIGLWQTELPTKSLKPAALAEKLKNLEGEWEGDAAAWLKERGAAPTGFESSLGTIGSGNHFAELQVVERVENESAFSQLGLDSKDALLCVHSGSRGLGEAILREHVDHFAGRGLAAGSSEASQYLARHANAELWARANRALIATRFLERIKTQGRRVLDLCHNSVQRMDYAGEAAFLHRKGAAPSNEGPVVIPGSRGAFSYLVQPVQPSAISAFSLAHGAGRKWSRSDSRGRLEKRYRASDLMRTSLGSHVICEDKDLLFEEAPQAYKNIDVVIADLVDAGLAEVIAVLRPLVTYKVRR
jgi:release factor H-coupled RctB family protein